MIKQLPSLFVSYLCPLPGILLCPFPFRSIDHDKDIDQDYVYDDDYYYDYNNYDEEDGDYKTQQLLYEDDVDDNYYYDGDGDDDTTANGQDDQPTADTAAVETISKCT